MSIIRVKKDTRYFVASNEPFQDKTLSWEAKGVMAYLLSKPDNWIVSSQDLIKQGPAGEHKVKSVLRELKRTGYMRRVREKGSKGRFEWVTEIYESKQLNPSIVLLSTDGQSTDGQSTDGQSIGGQKPHIVSTDVTSTEPTITKRDSTEGEGPARPETPSALKIYLSVTKIKKVEKIPEVVTDWLQEQEQYMAADDHPEALRLAIKDADKEGQVFNVEMLEDCFLRRLYPDGGNNRTWYTDEQGQLIRR